LHTPVQQSLAVLHLPLARHPHVCIELHATPPQQSAARVQAAPAAEHPHAEVVALHTPVQQSPSAVHAWVSAAQHFPKGQVPPLQQSLSTWQETPGAEQPHIPVVELQMPLQQFCAATAHGIPSGWHVPQDIDVPLSRHSRPEPLQQSEYP
jgi:hypothetical protein